MSGALVSTPARNLESRLAAKAHAIEAIGPSSWRLAGVHGIEATVDVQLEERWLVAETTAGVVEIGGAWLLAGTRAEGITKLVLAPRSRSLRRRVEIRLQNDGDDAVGRALAALAESSAAAAHSAAARAAVVRAAAGAAALDPMFVERCREIGWPLHERESGRIAVDLDVPGAFHQAEMSGEAAVRAIVGIVTVDQPPTLVRDAIGRFLLGTNGFVRLARGVVEATGETERFRLGYEVPLGPAPETEAIEDALLALSSATRRFGRELGELRRETLARCFLAARRQDS